MHFVKSAVFILSIATESSTEKLANYNLVNETSINTCQAPEKHKDMILEGMNVWCFKRDLIGFCVPTLSRHKKAL